SLRHNLGRNLLSRSLSSSLTPSRSRLAPCKGTATTITTTTPRHHWQEAARSPPIRRSYSACGGSCPCGGGGPPVKKTRTAYIALGSNLGDRVAEIERACSLMDERGIRVKRTSSLWETEPMYVEDQDRFINGACEVETDLEPLALLDQLQAIENDMGRRKVIDKGPRNIDLDILLYGDETVQHERLTALDPNKPWTLVQDHLNNLRLGAEPLSSITPVSASLPPLSPRAPTRPTHVMAILNLTPDSFSDGGRHRPSSVVGTVASLMRRGVSVVDVGGLSTAPGADEVSAEEEAGRVVPAIEAIRADPSTRGAVVSVDTYRASVAEAAVAAGADMVNDVSAGLLDPLMLPTVARLGVTVCLMHMRGNPRTMSGLASYPDGLIPTVAAELAGRVAAAEEAGIRRWRIVLDPGIGFAKDTAQNLELLRSLHQLRHWPGLENLPWLVGSSRKRFIGDVTGVGSPADRVWGTAATVAAAVQGGADVVRVHDAEEMAMVSKMSDAIWRAA
ncbi:2-amino-4-hydroxy-6-hydroxymethyldihydropteridine diphosphokinase / dihydropteroate synthase, partial [Geosmithia morbida]